MTEKFGLEIFHDPKDAEVDIVFVHGLGGDRIQTWTSPETEEMEERCWPRDFLPQTCRTARIMSFGYNASFAHFYPLYGPDNIPVGTTIDDHSASLFMALSNWRSKSETPSTRPIIFVAHSLGGLVCANALSRQHGPNDSNLSLVRCTLGVVFLGTPFEGSAKARWGDRGLQIMKIFSTTNDENMKDLKERSGKLMSVNDNFYKFIKIRDQSKSHLNVVCFFETFDTRVKKKSGIGLNISVNLGIIVPKASATVQGLDPIPIEATHSGMCKFDDPNRNGYKNIAETLSQWIKKLREPEAANEVPPSIKVGDTIYNAEVKSDGGVVMGNAVGTTEHAVKVTGSIRYYGDYRNPFHGPDGKPGDHN